MAGKQLADAVSFLEALADSLSDPGELARAQQGFLQRCLEDLRAGPGIAMGEAADMLKKVQAAKLTEGVKAELVKCVQEKATVSARPHEKVETKKSKMQSAEHICDYFTAAEWELLRNEALLPKSKKAALSTRCRHLGLLNPTEGTWKMLTAVLLLAGHVGDPQSFQLDPAYALKELQELKAVLRASCKDCWHSAIQEYPRLPSQLPEEVRRRAYPDLQAVACPLDRNALHVLRNQLAARHTHGSVAATSCKSFFGAGAMKGQPSMQALMGLAWMAHGLQGANQDLGGLQLLGGGQRKRPSRTQLALEDVPDLRGSPAASQGPPSQQAAVPEPSTLRGSPAGSERLPSQQAAVPEHSTDPAEALQLEESQEATAPDQREEVDFMAGQLEGQLAANKTPSKKRAAELPAETPAGKKTKAPARAKAKAAPAKAAAKAKAQAGKPAKAAKDLPCPGTASKPPLRFSNCTLYTATASQSWRVQLKGEKKDRAFCWGSAGAAKTWQRVQEYLATVKAETI